MEFASSRAYRSNDQAYIEQKNGAMVRKVRWSPPLLGPLAGQMPVKLHQSLRLQVTYFQSSFKRVS